MRVEGPTGLVQAMLGSVAARPSAAAAFEQPPAQPPGAPQPAATAAPMQSVAMLVTLAAAGADEPSRREAVRHASDGIDALAALHGALVAGLVAPPVIRRMRDWAQRRLRPDDPELAAVLDEVELRILVELAKLER